MKTNGRGLGRRVSVTYLDWRSTFSEGKINSVRGRKQIVPATTFGRTRFALDRQLGLRRVGSGPFQPPNRSRSATAELGNWSRGFTRIFQGPRVLGTCNATDKNKDSVYDLEGQILNSRCSFRVRDAMRYVSGDRVLVLAAPSAGLHGADARSALSGPIPIPPPPRCAIRARKSSVASLRGPLWTGVRLARNVNKSNEREPTRFGSAAPFCDRSLFSCGSNASGGRGTFPRPSSIYIQAEEVFD